MAHRRTFSDSTITSYDEFDDNVSVLFFGKYKLLFRHALYDIIVKNRTIQWPTVINKGTIKFYFITLIEIN